MATRFGGVVKGAVEALDNRSFLSWKLGETARLGERFFRGVRAAAAAPGSGLGLWIANAFMIANKGRIQASSPGRDRGTVMSISLPIPADQPVETDSASDE